SHHRRNEESLMPMLDEEGKQVNLWVVTCLQEKFCITNIFPPFCKNMARGRAPPEDSRCLVCLGCLNNPVVLRCNHRQCWSCVQSYWERTHSLKCPVCLEETMCKVSLENGRTEMPGSNNGNVFMEKTGDKMEQPKIHLQNSVNLVTSEDHQKHGNAELKKQKNHPAKLKTSGYFTIQEPGTRVSNKPHRIS
ncbi:nuclear factor 7, ovary-like, partial [Clarias magur]